MFDSQAPQEPVLKCAWSTVWALLPMKSPYVVSIKVNKTIAGGRRPSAGCSAAWRRLLDAWLEEVATMILRKLTILMASKRHFNSWISMVIHGNSLSLSLSLSPSGRPSCARGNMG